MKLRLAFCLVALGTSLSCANPDLSVEDRAALEIGRGILAVDEALKYELPDEPTPEQAAKADKLNAEMVRVGQVTQLYPWVGGRIAQEIAIAQHLLADTAPDDARARRLEKRVADLQRLRRIIDAPR